MNELFSMTEYVDKEQYEKEVTLMPLHRWGEESDISGVAIMLSSQAGEFITAQIIPVDGGTTFSQIGLKIDLNDYR